MSRLQTFTVAASLAACLILAASATWAQEALTAKPHASGAIHVTRGDVELAMIELNAHGPAWQHVSQEIGTADFSVLPDQNGARFVGTLPVPGTEGGAIEYTQSVTQLSQGLRIEYDLAMSQTMRLNGLQVSINLPVGQYGGKEVMVSQPHGDPKIAGLPAEMIEGRTQIWSGQGAKVEVGQGTEDAITIQLRAAADVLVQDLRQWEHQIFEIRFPAIMEDQGREVSAEDRFHLDLTVTFAAPVTLEAP